MNMKALVMGSEGRMGTAIVHALNKLDYKVSHADHALDGEMFDFKDLNKVAYSLRSNPDLVISALPYHLNWNIAKECVLKRIPYFDLGGHIETSDKINELAKKNHSLCLTDLGLAPGLINIMACHMANSNPDTPHSVYMTVGGIPSSRIPGDPLNYNLTWSFDGLVNEYSDDCLILQDGEIVQVPSLSPIHKEGEFESALTSGGACHSLHIFKEMGVRNCEYRTLRWPGHFDNINWLLDSTLGTQELKALLDVYGEPRPNMIVMKVRLEYENKTILTYSHTVYDDDEFSAMQKTTAFACVAAVHDAVSNHLNKPTSLNYRDVDFDFIRDTLNFISPNLV